MIFLEADLIFKREFCATETHALMQAARRVPKPERSDNYACMA
jgi:hypothetical protein